MIRKGRAPEGCLELQTRHRWECMAKPTSEKVTCDKKWAWGPVQGPGRLPAWRRLSHHAARGPLHRLLPLAGRLGPPFLQVSAQTSHHQKGLLRPQSLGAPRLPMRPQPARFCSGLSEYLSVSSREYKSLEGRAWWVTRGHQDSLRVNE